MLSGEDEPHYQAKRLRIDKLEPGIDRSFVSLCHAPQGFFIPPHLTLILFGEFATGQIQDKCIDFDVAYLVHHRSLPFSGHGAPPF